MIWKSQPLSVPVMRFTLFLYLAVVVISATSPPRVYPKDLHERVMKKLNRRKGNDKIGTWGKWSHWGACSKSCGTGVATQSRECLLTHTKKRLKKEDEEAANRCVGRYKRFQLCNTRICPRGLIDFRREQCSSYDRTPFNGRYFSWDPFIDSPESCALNCRARGLGFYATLNQSVIDGTPCGAFQPQIRVPNRICVGGKCIKVGCDELLGSGRVLDACGVCGGDNSTCRLISGLFSRSSLPFGFNFIASIPPKAENVSFYHTKPSSNYLALRDQSGHYILNGPLGVNSSGSFQASGTTFTYARPHAFGGDHLYAKGPTTTALDVMLFYQIPDPGVVYEYRLPVRPGDGKSHPRLHLSENSPNPVIPPKVVPRKPNFRGPSIPSPPGLVNDAISSNVIPRSRFVNNVFSHNKERIREKKQKLKKERQKKYKNKSKKHRKLTDKKRRKRYAWIVNGFTPCSQTCGGGTQTTRTVCVKRKRKEIEAPPHFCVGLPQPREEVVRCNLRPCPAQWEAKSWGSCSLTCGIGVQTRSLVCRQKVSTVLTIPVSDDSCVQSSNLVTAQVCEQRECNAPPKWDVKGWSDCSSQCGLGNRRRDVTCINTEGKVDESLCKERRPREEEMCDMGSCAPDTWFISEWEKTCWGPCGEGIQNRKLHCSGDAVEGKQSSVSCSKHSKPDIVRRCESKKACIGSWFAGPWSECDVNCGTGKQRRAVVCVTWSRGRYRVAKDNSPCKEAGEKPFDTTSCVAECKAEWFTSQWSQCSVSCDTGVQRRELKCLDQHELPSLECPSSIKPDSRQSCNTQTCRPDYLNDSGLVPKNDLHEILPNDAAYSGNGTLRQKEEEETKSKVASNFSAQGVCMDRMKNCHLVRKARLCRLKYYNKLCCKTCAKS